MGRGLQGYLRFTKKKALRNRCQILVALILTGLLLSFLASFSLFSRSESTQGLQPGFSKVAQSPSVDGFAFGRLTKLPQSDRPIFPYSVVPGGVHNLQEINEAVRTDPTVAKHMQF